MHKQFACGRSAAGHLGDGAAGRSLPGTTTGGAARGLPDEEDIGTAEAAELSALLSIKLARLVERALTFCSAMSASRIYGRLKERCTSPWKEVQESCAQCPGIFLQEIRCVFAPVHGIIVVVNFR